MLECFAGLGYWLYTPLPDYCCGGLVGKLMQKVMTPFSARGRSKCRKDEAQCVPMTRLERHPAR